MTADDEWRFGPLTVDADHVDKVSESEGVNSSENDVLESNSAVEPQSNQTVVLEGTRVTFEGERASMYALELSELLRSSVMQPFAIAPVAAEGAGLGGYFVSGNVTREPTLSLPDGQPGGVERVSARTLSRAGTQKSEWQAVATRPTQPDPGHPFGDAEQARVGIPAAASKVRAIDAAIGPSERTKPTPAFTVPAEYGDVDVYDALDIPFDDPIFIYDLDYDTTGRADPVVWDTLGNADKYDTSGSSPVRQWQHVFNPAHDPVGTIVLDNGLVRVGLSEIDDPDEFGEGAFGSGTFGGAAPGEITAEVWDAGGHGVAPHGTSPHGGLADDDNAAWTDVLINQGDWALVDIDLTHISPVRAAAQLEFENVTSGELYAVDVRLDRGLGRLHVWAPESVTDPIPSGLAAVLEPIADDSVYDTNLRQTLVSREEVRR